MALATEFGRARAMAWKDLRTERRSAANFSAVLFLALLMLLMFGFALGPDAQGLRDAASGVIWLAVLFSGVVAFNRSYQVELDDGAFETLLLYPGARWPIFLGKLLANLTFVLAVELIVVPLAGVLFHVNLTRSLFGLSAVLFLGTLGFVTLGTFYAAVASRTRVREVLLPLLLLPMLVPVLIAAAKATSALTMGDVMGDTGAWVRLLLAFDLIFFTASLAVYDVVIAG
ncbi:MAG TPA: heme exporter protein CcmB [Gemmatimonadaceae bacterium]|nr:heme exporter protein CcmB [Gemmatimonadaceae bacterium]